MRNFLTSTTISLLLLAPSYRQENPLRESSVVGTVTYDRVPIIDRTLRPDRNQRTPARGVVVQLVARDDRSILGTTRADGVGAYKLTADLAVAREVYVRAVAEDENVRVMRVANTSQYTVVSATFTLRPGEAASEDLIATHGNRGSGPFAIVGTIQRANDRLRALNPLIKPPALKVHWDTTYVGGTYFYQGEIWVNGNQQTESDEYDEHVLLHEYGHFLTTIFSRDDSPGDSHSPGEVVDPRLAWSEGWATFFAAAVLENPLYIDTQGDGSSFSFNLRDLAPSWESSPGYWSEHSVGSSLWELYEKSNAVLGSPERLSAIWKPFAGPLNSSTFTYLVDFADASVIAESLDPKELTAVLLKRAALKYNLGSTPSVTDPFPTPLQSGTPATGTVDSYNSRRTNLFKSSAFFSFSIQNEGEVLISLSTDASATPASADLDLYLLDDQNRELEASRAKTKVGSREEIRRRLPSGTYFVEVRSWGDANPKHDRVYNSGNFTLRADF